MLNINVRFIPFFVFHLLVKATKNRKSELSLFIFFSSSTLIKTNKQKDTTLFLWFDSHCIDIPGQENVPCPEGWFLCECSQTCIPPNQGDDPQNPSWGVCNGKNDCCGTIHGVLSHTLVCADHKKANYTALDEANCQKWNSMFTHEDCKSMKRIVMSSF